MKSDFRKILANYRRAAILFLLVFMIPVSACSPPEVKLNCEFKETSSETPSQQEVAVVLAPSDKFVDFRSATTSAKSEIADVIKSGDTKISIVIADGDPRTVANRYVDVSDQFTDTGKNQKVDDALAVIDRIVKCIELNDKGEFAYSDEINFLDAIQIGANSFESETSEKHIYVIGNGLQTTGTFNFVKGLNADFVANDVTVDDLVSKSSIGDLNGANVTWIGLGQTRQGEQQSLDENARKVLIDFWTKVVAAGGGKPKKIVAGAISEGTDPIGGIPTSVVPFEAVKACIEPITVTSEDGFEFNDDVATFKDRNKAKSSAERIKTTLDSAECLSGLTVTGYVASGGSAEGCARTPGFEMDLSLQRANAFKSLLEEVGVTIEITPAAGGLGPVVDCVNGVGDEDLMKQNRIAVITERK
jgi:outer membrane protein OmpA-like peptidoglycan-associated protein